jgi:hypothetical protein
MGKKATVFGVVRQSYAFGRPCKNDRVIADHRAAAQSGKTDRAFRPRAGDTLPGKHRNIFKVQPTPFGSGLAQQKRCARGRIDLGFMMHFNDFDIEIGAKRLGGLFHQARRAN